MLTTDNVSQSIKGILENYKNKLILVIIKTYFDTIPSGQKQAQRLPSQRSNNAQVVTAETWRYSLFNGQKHVQSSSNVVTACFGHVYA